MNFLIVCGLASCDIIGSKARTTCIKNKEHDRKHRKLDHLIDLAGDGSGVAGGGFVICWFYLILSNIHLQFYLEDDEGIGAFLW
ncbi:hypothetical protein RhiirB3_450657 [Rhizophagus irregularis]|nr:hypothetical protein RhiirB3_450657 [Rhizophagus irregularis]